MLGVQLPNLAILLKRNFMCRFILILSLGFFSNFVYAYLDPGSGSVIIQAIIGVIASALFFIKMFWFKIKKFMKNFFDKIFRK